MGIKLSNNAFGTLAAGINSSATSITLTSGQGARFPTLGAGDFFYATLVDTSNNLEIVKCTARSTDVLTVTRAQESTTARSYSAGDRIEIRLTAQTFLDAVAEIGPTQVSDELNTATGYFQVAKGTTAQRPASPATGMVRFNTDLNYLEEYRDNVWQVLSNAFAAEGGTVTTSGGYKIHTFTSSGTFTVISGSKTVEYLVVGGGGGGGVDFGGGGGAGGFRTGSLSIAASSNTITVGAGGANGNIANGNPTGQTSGGDSIFSSITSIGGGRGSSGSGLAASNNALSGGSGGGGGGYTSSRSGASGTAGQGNAGGSGAGDSGNLSSCGGGGGGAGGAGANAVLSNQGGNGGTGSSSSISGSSVTYAGGGGGSVYNAGTPGSGGAGGGGAGGSQNPNVNGGNGSANTGGGGGAAYNIAGSGGSGIVIIRYLI